MHVAGRLDRAVGSWQQHQRASIVIAEKCPRCSWKDGMALQAIRAKFRPEPVCDPLPPPPKRYAPPEATAARRRGDGR